MKLFRIRSNESVLYLRSVTPIDVRDGAGLLRQRFINDVKLYLFSCYNIPFEIIKSWLFYF